MKFSEIFSLVWFEIIQKSYRCSGYDYRGGGGQKPEEGKWWWVSTWWDGGGGQKSAEGPWWWGSICCWWDGGGGQKSVDGIWWWGSGWLWWWCGSTGGGTNWGYPDWGGGGQLPKGVGSIGATFFSWWWWWKGLRSIFVIEYTT